MKKVSYNKAANAWLYDTEKEISWQNYIVARGRQRLLRQIETGCKALTSVTSHVGSTSSRNVSTFDLAYFLAEIREKVEKEVEYARELQKAAAFMGCMHSPKGHHAHCSSVGCCDDAGGIQTEICC